MKTNETLAGKFAESVAAQTDAIRKGDSKAGNKHAKRYIDAFNALRSEGDAGRAALVPMLKHPRADVRGMAAAFLLRFRTEESLAVLNDLARGTGIVAFGANETLNRWRDGTWSLDPPE